MAGLWGLRQTGGLSDGKRRPVRGRILRQYPHAARPDDPAHYPRRYRAQGKNERCQMDGCGFLDVFVGICGFTKYLDLASIHSL